MKTSIQALTQFIISVSKKELPALARLVTLVVVTFSVLVNAAPREIEIKTQKIGESVHWMPEKVEVKQGEKIKFLVKHELEGGFDFHGFTISELKIAKQVNRNKTLEVEAEIPNDLAVGTYKITCQFHPKHMPAGFMVVKSSTK